MHHSNQTKGPARRSVFGQIKLSMIAGDGIPLLRISIQASINNYLNLNSLFIQAMSNTAYVLSQKSATCEYVMTPKVLIYLSLDQFRRHNAQ